ncbi:hypothetical protein C0993_004691, partial [Termitomyces sp. T159_Od127]
DLAVLICQSENAQQATSSMDPISLFRADMLGDAVATAMAGVKRVREVRFEVLKLYRILDTFSMMLGDPLRPLPSAFANVPHHHKIPLESLNKFQEIINYLALGLDDHLKSVHDASRGFEMNHFSTSPDHLLALYTELVDHEGKKDVANTLINLTVAAIHAGLILRGNLSVPSDAAGVGRLIVENGSDTDRQALALLIERSQAGRRPRHFHNQLDLALTTSPLLLLLPREYSEIAGRESLLDMWAILGSVTRPPELYEAERLDISGFDSGREASVGVITDPAARATSSPERRTPAKQRQGKQKPISRRSTAQEEQNQTTRSQDTSDNDDSSPLTTLREEQVNLVNASRTLNLRPRTKNQAKTIASKDYDKPRRPNINIRAQTVIELTIEETDFEVEEEDKISFVVDRPLEKTSTKYKSTYFGQTNLPEDMEWFERMERVTKGSDSSLVKIITHEEYTRLGSSAIMSLLKANACIVITEEAHVDVSFSEETLASVFALDEPTTLHGNLFRPWYRAATNNEADFTIPGPGKLRTGTLIDLFDAMRANPPKALNCLYLPDSHDSFPNLPYSTDTVAWKRTRRHTYCGDDRLFPVPDMRWAIASTGATTHYWHVDSDGFGTFIQVVTGCKIWYVATPKSGLFDDFADVSLFTHEYDISAANDERWNIARLVLVPGTTFGLVHWYYVHPKLTEAMKTAIKNRSRARKLLEWFLGRHLFTRDGMACPGGDAYEKIFAPLLVHHVRLLIIYKNLAYDVGLNKHPDEVRPQDVARDIDWCLRGGPAWGVYNQSKAMPITHRKFPWEGEGYQIEVQSNAAYGKCFLSPSIVFPNCLSDIGEHADGCVFGDWKCAKAMGISLLEGRSNTFLQHANDEPFLNESTFYMDPMGSQPEESPSNDGTVNPGAKRRRSNNSSSSVNRGKLALEHL